MKHIIAHLLKQLRLEEAESVIEIVRPVPYHFAHTTTNIATESESVNEDPNIGLPYGAL